MIKPVGFMILVKPDPVEETFKSSSIAIPDSVLEKSRVETTLGTILAIGNLAWKGIQGGGDPWAAVGDHVIYAKYGGKLIDDPETGEKLVLLVDKDILGVL